MRSSIEPMSAYAMRLLWATSTLWLPHSKRTTGSSMCTSTSKRNSLFRFCSSSLLPSFANTTPSQFTRCADVCKSDAKVNMGKLLDGRWVPTKEQTRIDKRGGFVRGTTKFRDWVRRDGSSVFAPQARPLPSVGGSQLSVGASDRHHTAT